MSDRPTQRRALPRQRFPRIVRGLAAGEDELKVLAAPAEAIGLDDARGSLNRSKRDTWTGEGTIRIDAELSQRARHLSRLKVAIFVAQGVDARRHQVFRMRHWLGKLRQGEDASIVRQNPVPQVGPDATVRAARIDVAAPEPLPFPLRAQSTERYRLRIMDEDEIRLGDDRGQTAGVLTVRLLEDLRHSPSTAPSPNPAPHCASSSSR